MKVIFSDKLHNIKAERKGRDLDHIQSRRKSWKAPIIPLLLYKISVKEPYINNSLIKRYNLVQHSKNLQ